MADFDVRARLPSSVFDGIEEISLVYAFRTGILFLFDRFVVLSRADA